jgi:hypothetical protein
MAIEQADLSPLASSAYSSPAETAQWFTSRHTTDPLADLPPLLPVPMAAAILGFSRASAYRYAARGDLPVRHLGGRVFVVTARLRQLIEGADEAAA